MRASRLSGVSLLCAVCCVLSQPVLADTAPPPEASEQTTTVRALLLPDAETSLASVRLGQVSLLNASLGSTFARGDVLVELDCREPKAQLRVVQAQVPGAREKHQALQRLQSLGQASEVDVALAGSEFSSLQEQAGQLRGIVDQCQIRAPWAGRVSAVHVREFSTVAPGEPLLELVKTGPLRVQMNLPSRLSPSLRAGLPFVLMVDETGSEHMGKIEAINSRIDPVSQTIEVRGRLDEIDDILLPGMSGRVRLLDRP